jgi:hypothetical protein
MINLTHDEQGTYGHGSYDPRPELNYARESGLAEKQVLPPLTVTRQRLRDARAAQLIRHGDKAPDTPRQTPCSWSRHGGTPSVITFFELATGPT